MGSFRFGGICHHHTVKATRSEILLVHLREEIIAPIAQVSKSSKQTYCADNQYLDLDWISIAVFAIVWTIMEAAIAARLGTKPANIAAMFTTWRIGDALL